MFSQQSVYIVSYLKLLTCARARAILIISDVIHSRIPPTSNSFSHIVGIIYNTYFAAVKGFKARRTMSDNRSFQLHLNIFRKSTFLPLFVIYVQNTECRCPILSCLKGNNFCHIQSSHFHFLLWLSQLRHLCVRLISTKKYSKYSQLVNF